MLYATGLKEEDMNKPQIGIGSVWYEGNPCNMHLLELSESVKEGVQKAGCVGYRFNTIGVSDGISMGTSGMRYSLQSRDLIADSMETTMGAQWYDGLIALPGCDKNMPGCVMAMARLNRPSIMVYGGTIRAGKAPTNGATLDIVSAFQSYGQYVYDKITEEERKEIIQHACPGPGACGGMYTANTMATAIEALGKSLPEKWRIRNNIEQLWKFIMSRMVLSLSFCRTFPSSRYVFALFIVIPCRFQGKERRM